MRYISSTWNKCSDTERHVGRKGISNSKIIWNKYKTLSKINPELK
jgi:hypothetical protein